MEGGAHQIVSYWILKSLIRRRDGGIKKGGLSAPPGLYTSEHLLLPFLLWLFKSTGSLMP